MSDFKTTAKEVLPASDNGTSDKYSSLEAIQTSHVEAYGRNKLVELVRTDEIFQNTKLQDSLLDVLQVWSDHFQRLIRIRSASARDGNFSALADLHLKDEIDHNHILAEMRGNRPVQIWDATLEAAAAWFAEHMAKASDVESTILMHLVIEEAGDIFFKAGVVVFPDSKHFQFHGNHDEDHASMGMQLLKRQSQEPVERMIATLNQGWEMMNLLCNRMAELAIARANTPTAYMAPDHPNQKPSKADNTQPKVGG
jgi:hypothetical protein